MEFMDFGSSENLLRYVQEKSDDWERAVIYCTDWVQMTFPNGAATGRLPTKNLGMVLYTSDRPVLLTKTDAAVVLNDGILNRMKIRIEIL
jgi:hypothetical protein